MKLYEKFFQENTSLSEPSVYKVITQGCLTVEDSETNEPDLDSAESYLRDIQKAIDNDWREMDKQKGLAEYIGTSTSRDKLLSLVILSIPAPQAVKDNTGTFGAFLLHWKVVCSEKLTPEQEKSVIEYIEGQNSDGWGEGFEQHAISEWHDTIEVEAEVDDDEDTGWHTPMEKIPVTMRAYAHPWYMTTPGRPIIGYPNKRIKPTITLVSGG